MVKRPAFILTVVTCLVCLSCLTSCDLLVAVLSLSPFPRYLPQAVASVDMGSEIQDYVGGKTKWRSQVHVLRNAAGHEHVFLIVRKDYGGQRVYALDTNLNLISYGSIIDQHYPLALVDANGDFAVGNVLFDAADMSNPISDYPDVSVNWDDQAFAHGWNNYILRSYYDSIECQPYNPSWVSSGPTTTVVGSAFDVWLRGIGYDRGVGEVYLIFAGHDPGANEEFLQIVRTPAGDYPDPDSPLYSYYTVSSPVYGVRGWSPCYYTRKGVVAGSHKRGRYMLISLHGDVIKRFRIADEDEPALDFDIDGKYYYILDEADMRLYKAATGF